MSLNAKLHLVQHRVVNFKLAQLATVRVMDKIKSVAARGDESSTEKTITFAILDRHVQVGILIFAIGHMFLQLLIWPN